MSDKPITDGTNRPSPKKAASAKLPSLEPPVPSPNEPFPPLLPVQGEPVDQTEYSTNEVHWSLPQRREADFALTSEEPNAKRDASEPSYLSRVRSWVSKQNDTALMPPGGEGADVWRSHSAGPSPPQGYGSELWTRHDTEPLPPRRHRAGSSPPRDDEDVPSSTSHPPPPANEGTEINSMSPYEATAETLPPDENIPISPGGAAESPPGQSHTTMYLHSPDQIMPKAITSGHGPNHPGLTGPLPPRFSEHGNEFSQGIADMAHELGEARIRTTLGNALATQEAAEAGVIQRDFAPTVERQKGTLGTTATNTQTMKDPEATDYVNPIQASIMQDRQEERFAEFWESPAFQLLIDMWLSCNPQISHS